MLDPFVGFKGAANHFVICYLKKLLDLRMSQNTTFILFDLYTIRQIIEYSKNIYKQTYVAIIDEHLLFWDGSACVKLKGSKLRIL